VQEPCEIVEDVAGLYRIVTLPVLRRTPGVYFGMVPVSAIASIDAIDRLIHERGPFLQEPSERSSAPGACTRVRTIT